MQRMFGLILIVALIWFALAAYSGGGLSIDLDSWLQPIGAEDPVDGAYSEPDLGDVPADEWDRSPQERRGLTGRESVSKPESLPQAMKRRVMDAYQKDYDRTGR